jgi:FMN phosphatase YigB (HAD superfamily)
MTKLYSFDVFGTALLRRTAFPSDVFRMVAEVAAKDFADRQRFVEDFVAARVEAEKAALAASPHEECGLEQIWNELRCMLPDLPPTCGPGSELKAESSVLVANRQIAKEIAGLRSGSARIIFVSDTYLPEEFVRTKLMESGVANERDGFYVSSALGLTKRSGNLFKHVLTRENIRARDVRHLGDDAYSDVTTPGKLGITCTLYQRTQLNRWERALVAGPDAGGDEVSLLAGWMRIARINAEPGADGVNELVTTFLGPLILTWASWVLGAARRDGVKRLYFSSRDGYLAWRAATVLAPAFGDIDCRYLKISRQSILLPSVNEVSPTAINWLRRSFEVPQLDRLLKKLELSWPEVSFAFAKQAGGDGEFKHLETEQDWTEFWTTLQLPTVANLIHERAKRAKALAVTYLTAEGLLDDVPFGIVDIGWNLTVQSALKKLLSGSSAKFLSGYYLGLAPDRRPPSEAGPSKGLFYNQIFDRGGVTKPYAIFNRISILEHVLGIAPHGTVRGYREIENIVAPIHDDVSEADKKIVQKIEKALESFCREQADLAEGLADERTARILMDGLISSWCAAPSVEGLKPLARLAASEDQNNIGARLLVDPWNWKSATKYLMPHRWHKAFNVVLQKPIWPEAAIACSKLIPAAIVRLRQWVDVNVLRHSRVS